MQITILDGWQVNPGDICWAPLEQLGQCTFYDTTADNERAERLAGAEAAITNRVYIGAAEMDASPALRYIGLFATGTNKVDLAAAAARGITVCNVPGYSTEAVSQHTVALLLAITNRVASFNTAVQNGGWESALGLANPMKELAGKTFGCIGFGAIGRATGQIAGALGMQVLATGSRPTAEGEAIASYTTLEDLLRRSDIVSLHCPLKADTEKLINQGTLAQCKPGAILLNTARGGLLDEAAVAEALASGRLYAAGVDVVDGEPILPNNPLLQAPNCIITPHVAWAPPETRQRLVDIVAQNLAAWQAGKPQNVVAE